MIVFSKKLRAKLRNYFRFLRFDGDKSFASPQTEAKPDLLNDGFAAEVCRRRDTLHQFDGRDNHTVSRFQQDPSLREGDQVFVRWDPERSVAIKKSAPAQ